jgi:HSP20 family molecular chaperone IbpA
MPLPQLTDKQRAAVLAKAAAARRARAELKDRLKRGDTNLKQVLQDAETDEVLGKMKVSAMLELLPRVGKVRAQQIMTELEIAQTRRLRGLGDRQRKALLETFDLVSGPQDDVRLGRQGASPAQRQAVPQHSKPPALGRASSHPSTEPPISVAELRDWVEADVSPASADVVTTANRVLPAAEVVKDGDDALVRLKLPGVDVGQDVSVEVDKGVLTIRLPGAVTEDSIAPRWAVTEREAIDDQAAAAVPIGLLDKLTAATAAQVSILRQIEAVAAHSRPERVTLDTPTGTMEYTLPISLDETYSSAAVSEILSPTGRGHRSIAQHRRRSNKLLAIKIDGNQYRYPKFQIDPARHEIRPIVAYANRLLECNEDPWGSLDWWYSEDEALDDRRPIDLLESGELTEELVDFAVKLSQQGMD